MPIQLCLLVPIVYGETARQALLDVGALNQMYTPERIGDELALPIFQGMELKTVDFEHRLDNIDVRTSPEPIDPHSRLQQCILPLIDFDKKLAKTIPRKWERLDDLILFPKDAFVGDEWDAVLQQHMISSNELPMRFGPNVSDDSNPLLLTKCVRLRLNFCMA